MQIHEIGGEHGYIERIRTRFGTDSDRTFLGIGDDAAILPPHDGREVIVTTDMIVENVHFRREWSDPYAIGWKAAAVNLSDIAAMGGAPTYTFVALGVKLDETVENLDALYDGIMDCLGKYGGRLAGGDTNSSPLNLVISITQMGLVERSRAIVRTGATAGDRILVTGELGNSAAGLSILSQFGAAKAAEISPLLVLAHTRPIPRIAAGLAAASTGKVHAAMDLSDGLLGDIKKLCKASGVGFRIDSEKLPRSSELTNAACIGGFDPLQTALVGGEDYELLLIVAPEDVDTVLTAVASTGTLVTEIGEIVEKGCTVLPTDGTGEQEPKSGGWDHFAS